MADRLIYADKLKAHYAWWKGGTREMTMDEAKSDFDTIIDLQPTADAEFTVHAHWIVPAMYPRTAWCSACKERVADEFYKYCPHCGAKMDEVEE